MQGPDPLAVWQATYIRHITDKTESLLIGNERQWSKYLSMFPIEVYGVNSNSAKSARNLGGIFDKNFTFCSHISAVCSSCFYHMRDLRRIRRHLALHNYLQLLSCPVVSIIASHFCVVSRTLTSHGFSKFRIDWPTW